MSSLETRKIEPLSGTTVTLGASGDAVTMPAGVTLKTNTVKDAGGNTILTSNGSGTLSSVNAGLQGNMIFISSQTASSSSSISFTSGIDSTYDEYVFYGINMNPASGGSGTDGPNFQWQCNVSGQTGFNEAITSTAFGSYHRENDASSSFGYNTYSDQGNGTAYQMLTINDGSAADQGACFELRFYNPSSTTYVKHFSSWTQHSNDDEPPYAWQLYHSGYVNVTGAITEFAFAYSSGNITDGTIALYGIK